MVRTVMTARHCACLLALCCALLACAGARTEKLQEFDTVLRNYNNMLQYHAPEEAAKFAAADKQADAYAKIDALLKAQSISDYQVRSVTMDDKQTEATVEVLREVYDLSTYEVKSVKVVQKWKRLGKDWVLESGDY